MREQFENIAHKIKLLAIRLHEMESNVDSLTAENQDLKLRLSKIQGHAAQGSTGALDADQAAQQELFQQSVNQAKKAKRELELYLREMERKIENIKF